MTLINKAKVVEYLQTTISITDTDFKKYISEAQEFDVKTLFCEDFYNELLLNPTDAKFVKLLEGGNYTVDGKTYMFSGLGKVIAYFAYARFILKSNFTSTAHGFVTKKSPHSEPMSSEDKRTHYHNYRKEANLIFKDVENFLKRNSDDYPECDFECETSKTNSFKTRVIQ